MVRDNGDRGRDNLARQTYSHESLKRPTRFYQREATNNTSMGPPKTPNHSPTQDPPPNHAHAALEIFIGMLYACMLSVIIDNTDDAQLFENHWISLLVILPMFIFFAHDWIGRTIATRVTPVSQAPNSKLFLRLLTDVAVVYFLLLASLALISLLDPSKKAPEPLRLASEKGLLLRLAWFSLACWLWNIVAVWHATILTPDDRRHIFSLYLPARLVKAHFGHIGQWQSDMESRFKAEDAKCRKAITNAGAGPIVGTDSAREAMRPIRRAARLLIGSGLRNSYKILFPYAILMKVLVLDIMIGSLLILRLESELPPWPLALPFSLLPLLAALIAYTLHLSPRGRAAPRSQRCGNFFLIMFFALLYTGLSNALLAIAVILQQIAATAIMLKDFQVHAPTTSVGLNT